MNKRAGELAPNMGEFLALSSDLDNDNPQDQNSQDAGFYEDSTTTWLPSTTKNAPGDSEAAEPRRKHRLRRITKIDKILTSVRAGSPAIQLILPDGESDDLDMDVDAQWSFRSVTSPDTR